MSPATLPYTQVLMCQALNLTPHQITWEMPNAIVNQWEHVLFVREGVPCRRAVKSARVREKIDKLIAKAVTSRKK